MTLIVPAGFRTQNNSTDPTFNDSSPQVTRLNNGNVVLTTIVQENADKDVWITILSPDGKTILTETAADDGQAQQRDGTSVTALSNGGFVVAWSELISSSPIVFGIKARVFAADGTPKGGVFEVFDDFDFDGSRFDTAPLDAGGFAVAATSQDGTFLRAFQNSGNPRADSVAIPAGDTRNDISLDAVAGGKLVAITQSKTVGQQFDRFGRPTQEINLALGPLQSGTTLEQITNTKTLAVASIGTETGGRIAGQIYNKNGAPTSGVFFIGDAAGNGDVRPDIAVMDNGNALVVWVDRGISPNIGQGRIIDSNGVPQSPVFDISMPDLGGGLDFHAESLDNGNVLITWGQVREDRFTNYTSWHQVFATDTSGDVQSVTRGSFNGTRADDVVAGSARDDKINGAGGNDALHGGTGADLILGKNGADLLYGDDGADTLTGGSGNDTLSGGNGNDLLQGSKGHDLLLGNNGGDTVQGGGGNDTAYGGAGNDELIGGSGRDKLNGGADNDVIRGGKGSDTLQGGEGRDKLIGGGGADTFVYMEDDGRTVITDFELLKDRLDVSDVFFFSAPTPESFVEAFATVQNGNTRIVFNEMDILLMGVTDLDALATRIDTDFL